MLRFGPLRLLYPLLRIAIPATVGWLLARAMGPWSALGLAPAVFAVTTTIAAVALRGAGVGSITWHNRLAGWLLPFAFLFGGRSLIAMALSSTLAQTLLAGAGIAFQSSAVSANPGATTALVIAWVVDGAVLLWFLTVLVRGHVGSSSSSSLLRIALFVAALLVSSVILHVCGLTGVAALVAGGPPLLAGLGYGGFILMWILSGKRWQ